MREAGRRSGYMPLSGPASGRPLMINSVSRRGHRQILLATFPWPKIAFPQPKSPFKATRRRNLSLDSHGSPCPPASHTPPVIFDAGHVRGRAAEQSLSVQECPQPPPGPTSHAGRARTGAPTDRSRSLAIGRAVRGSQPGQSVDHRPCLPVFFRWLHFRQPRRQQPHVAAHSSDHRIGSGLSPRGPGPAVAGWLAPAGGLIGGGKFGVRGGGGVFGVLAGELAEGTDLRAAPVL